MYTAVNMSTGELMAIKEVSLSVCVCVCVCVYMYVRVGTSCVCGVCVGDGGVVFVLCVYLCVCV